MPSLPFSQRYERALRNGVLSVDLSADVRTKLLQAIGWNNHAISEQLNPDDPWLHHTDIVSELVRDLHDAGAWKGPDEGEASPSSVSRFITDLVTHAPGQTVLDAIEVMWASLVEDWRGAFVASVNAALEESCWRIANGTCIKLDPEFVGAGAIENALRALTSGPFTGAADEYVKAMRELASGDVKDAISDAAKSFESTLKVLTGLEHVNADRLLKEFVAQGYLDDLPDSVREGFRGTVLMSVAFMRNKLSSHGQGADVIDVPPLYGTLALQTTAALHNFLIAKYLERNPQASSPHDPDDDVIF